MHSWKGRSYLTKDIYLPPADPTRVVRAIVLATTVALTVLSAAMVFTYAVQACHACSRSSGSQLVAIAGVAWYGTLTLLVYFRVAKGLWISRLAFLGLAVHSFLSVKAGMEGALCVPCLVAWALAILLWTVSSYKVRSVRAGYLAGLGLLIVCGIAWSNARPASDPLKGYLGDGWKTYFDSSPGEAVVLMVRDSHCRLCDQFTREVAPRLKSEFGPRVIIKELSAEGAGLSSLPMIVVGRSDSGVRITKGTVNFATIRSWLLSTLHSDGLAANVHNP